MAHSGPGRRTRLASVWPRSRSRGQCPGSGSAVTLGAGASCAVPGLPASRPCSPETGPAITRLSQQTGTRGSSGSGARVTPGPWTRTRLRPLGRSRSQIPLLCDSPSSETHGYSLGQVSVTLDTWPHRSSLAVTLGTEWLVTGAVTSADWSRVTCYELGCEIVTRVITSQ